MATKDQLVTNSQYQHNVPNFVYCQKVSHTAGSCLAMSPPTKTASRYTQRFWTTIQFSIISEELVRFCTQVWICFLNGVLYLKQRQATDFTKILSFNDQYLQLGYKSSNYILMFSMFFHTLKLNGYRTTLIYILVHVNRIFLMKMTMSKCSNAFELRLKKKKKHFKANLLYK